MLHHVNTDAPSQIGIVFNGSPLFTGEAGSGESEIRRWILENDWLVALVALPEQMFYNTGIQTYLWILTTRKSKEQERNVMLFDASGESFWKKLPKAFAELATSKKKEKSAREAEIAAGRLLQEGILTALRTLGADILRSHADFVKRLTKALKAADLKPKKTVFKAILDSLSERDELAEPVIAETIAVPRAELPNRLRRAELARRVPELPRYGSFHLDHPDDKSLVLLIRYESDNDLKDFENVPLGTDIIAYFEREVLPHAPDAWISPDFTDDKDKAVGKVGYEINFNRHFYTYQPPRVVAEIDENIRKVEKKILDMLKEVMG